MSGAPAEAAADDRDRSIVDNAQLALLLEVAGTPKPGNVDRMRDHGALTFETFLAGAVGARPGLADAVAGAPLGPAFERSVAGMARQRGGNTQFGALLLLVPLARAAGADALDPDGLDRLTRETTVADAAAFYRAFEHVDVTVGAPPESIPDVREGAAAVPALRDRSLTLRDVMAAGVPGAATNGSTNGAGPETDQSAPVPDDNAREWTAGFPRTFRIADLIAARTRPPDDDSAATPSDAVARAYLDALARRPDSLVAVEHGPEIAAAVRERAAALVTADRSPADPEVEAFADDLVERGINPGTTADVVAAGTFVALERGGLRV